MHSLAQAEVGSLPLEAGAQRAVADDQPLRPETVRQPAHRAHREEEVAVTLALLEAADRPDHRPPRVEPERRLGGGRVWAAAHAFDVDAARDDRPAPAYAVRRGLAAQRVRVGDDGIDHGRDQPPVD